MCAIIGGINSALPRGLILQALDSMAHRGPDDVGLHQFGEAFLGARRLAIIDTAGGHQPIGNEDGTIFSALNGEIYNYRELTAELLSLGHRFKTHCDTEVLVHGYEQWGDALPAKLSGMFAFAIWDQHNQSFFVARDRFGKKPFYYLQHGSSFFFASEIKALRCLVKANVWKIREQSIYDYLSLLAVPQPQTIYENVSMLPAATYGSYRNGRFFSRSFWELNHAKPDEPLSYSKACAEVRSIVEDAVRIRLRSDVPLGIFLSGGIDSSLIAFEAAKVIGPSLRTFTISVENSVLNEAPVAERTARALGVKNEVIPLEMNPAQILEFLVPHFDQPFADASAIPSFAVAKRARDFVTVVLNGDGGDEIFGGYRRYIAARLSDHLPGLGLAGRLGADKITRLLARDRRDIAGFVNRLVRGATRRPGERYLIWTTDALFEEDKRSSWQGSPMEPTESLIEALLPRNSSAFRTQMEGDRRIILPGLLVKMDMATMLASVEARSPLLDHRLAQLTASLPDSYLVRGTRAKALLRDAYAGVLPTEVVRAKKRGFETPLKRWLRHELREMLNDLVAAPNAKVTDFLSREFIRGLVNGTCLHERNREYILYSLLVLEIWLRSQQVALHQPALLAVA